jgi:hypothetical protein
MATQQSGRKLSYSPSLSYASFVCAVAVQSEYIMLLHVSRPGGKLHGRQVCLLLLVILVSHVLLMTTPPHDLLLLGHRAGHKSMDAHSVHSVTSECVGPADTGGGTGVDCALRRYAPALGLWVAARVILTGST